MDEDIWDSVKVEDMLFAVNRKDEIYNCWYEGKCYLPAEWTDKMRAGAEKARAIRHASTLRKRMGI